MKSILNNGNSMFIKTFNAIQKKPIRNFILSDKHHKTPTKSSFNILRHNFSILKTPKRLIDYSIIENSNNVGLITIKNWRKKNSLPHDIVLAFQDILEKINSDFIKNKFPRVLILNSEGDVFSSGHDLQELSSSDDSKKHEIFTKFSELMLLMNKSHPIIIAEIQGLATAAGCQLANNCDLILASSKAQFEMPGVKIGLFPLTPAVPLCRTIGNKKAMEMLLTSEPIDCKKAYDFGLINEIVDVNNLSIQESKQKLREHSLKYAEKINKFSYKTLSFGKQVFYEQIQQQNIEASYKITSEAMCKNLNFIDTKEGVKAFLEKRKPRFNQ